MKAQTGGAYRGDPIRNKKGKTIGFVSTPTGGAILRSKAVSSIKVGRGARGFGPSAQKQPLVRNGGQIKFPNVSVPRITLPHLSFPSLTDIFGAPQSPGSGVIQSGRRIQDVLKRR